MSGMFYNATNFNQPLDSWDMLDSWDRSIPVRTILENRTIPAEPLNVIEFDENRLSVYSDSFGSDIIMGGESDKTRVSEFIAESQTDNEIPVIMKLLDTNKKEHDSIYLFTKTNLETMLTDSIVYPCWQDSGFFNIKNDGINDDAPEGVIRNVRENIQLYSMNNVFNRNILVTLDTLDTHINSESNTPIFIVFVPTSNFYKSISKIPFVAGVSQLHCNPGFSDTLTVYDLKNGNYTNQSMLELGGAKRVNRKRNLKTTKRTKSKPKVKPKTKPNVKSHRTKKRNCRKCINKTKKRGHSHRKTKKRGHSHRKTKINKCKTRTK